jgi:hypothetical protein
MAGPKKEPAERGCFDLRDLLAKIDRAPACAAGLTGLMAQIRMRSARSGHARERWQRDSDIGGAILL